MSAIFAIAKKEFKTLSSEPRLIGFLFFMPFLLLLLFGFALKIEPTHLKMAYVDEDKSYFSSLIKTNLWNEGYFELYEVASKENIIDEIRANHAKAGLFIAKTFSKDLTDNLQPHVQFFVDGTMPSLTTAMKNQANAINDESVSSSMYFLDEDAQNIMIAQEPFLIDTEILFNPDAKETWFFIPGVIGVLIMQITLLLAGISVVREKEHHTLEQLIVSPLKHYEFIFGKVTPYILISLFEFYFILLLGWLIFEIPIPSSAYVGVFLLSLVYVSAMITLGLFISMVSQTQQQAMFLAIFIMIPSILLAGFMFPIEAMPEFIQPIAYAIPFTYFVEIIRGLLIKETPLLYLMFDYFALVGYTLFFGVMSYIVFKRANR